MGPKESGGKKISRDQLLNLEVKVLTQQLGTANQWAIRAEGRVSFSDLTIRVHALPKEEEKQKKGVEDSAASIVLEDVINTETPFVGENCCIVWNSVEQQLSLCLMYADEEGYAASWSALVAMQDKTYPAFGFDLLERCSSKMSDPQPYSSIIHGEYDPPLGFIERHAISLSIIENQHYKSPSFFSSKEMMVALLNIANIDLVEYLVSVENYPSFSGALGCGEEVTSWSIPSSLTKLQLPEELISYIVKDLNLSRLQEYWLADKKNPEILTKIKSLGDRLRNELACTLLASDRTLVQAKEALMVMPPSNTESPKAPSSIKLGSAKFQSDVIDKMGSSKAEQQVLAHLHFFRCLVRLCITELGPDLVGPIVMKIFHSGLLEALSFVAERYALPKGLSAAFLAGLNEDRGSRGGQFGRGGAVAQNSSMTGNTCYNAAIEHELTCLLDATIIRLNERQEDQLLNDIIRSPILAEPSKYNGLMTFLFRQLLTEGKRSYVDHAISDGIGVGNPFLLFHVLGLHDDEGAMTDESTLNPNAELSSVKDKFQTFVVSKYIPLTTRGMLAVPSPPAGKNDAPLVQFQVSNTSKVFQLPQGISAPLIRVLEYLSLSTSVDNRAALLKAVFSHKSLVLQYIEGCFAVASKNPRAIRQDVLCGNVRFMKSVLGQLMPGDSSPILDKNSKLSDGQLPKSTITAICRAITVERDTLGSIFQAYNDFGGIRRSSVFHSSVLSLLDIIAKNLSSEKTSDEGNDLRDVRDFIYFKHLHNLPRLFAEKFRQSLLAETTARLGEDTGYLGSVSILSSVAGSELLRSTSKLRFVDEVEAASGGVDGTVEPSSLSGLSPTIVASMQDAGEDKLKKRMRATVSSILGTSGRNPGSGWGSPNPERNSLVTSPGKVLKPTAPKNEKQAVSARPQRSYGEAPEIKRTDGNGISTSGNEEHVVLPKLKKRSPGGK